METVKAKLKKEKLEHYAKRELQDFYQIDGWTEQLGDAFLNPDKDGVCVTGSVTHELMNGADTIRILVKRGASKEKALLALRKMVNQIEKDGFDWYEQEAKRQDKFEPERQEHEEQTQEKETKPFRKLEIPYMPDGVLTKLERWAHYAATMDVDDLADFGLLWENTPEAATDEVQKYIKKAQESSPISSPISSVAAVATNYLTNVSMKDFIRAMFHLALQDLKDTTTSVYLGDGQDYGRGYCAGKEARANEGSAYLAGFTKGFEEERTKPQA